MGALSYLLKQGGLAAAHLGTGYAFSKYSEIKGEGLKAYYGESEYTRRFHGYYDKTSALFMGAGIVGAGAALMKQDPITSLGGNIKKFINYRREAAPLKEIISSNKIVNAIDGVTYFNVDRPLYSSAEKASASVKLKKLRQNNASNIASFSQRLVVSGLLTSGIVSFGLSHPTEAIATTAASGAFMGGKYILKNMKTAALGGSALIAGGVAASMRTPYPTAEAGNTDFQYDRSSVVNRMNFSTANLVQALYRNRKAT